MEKSPPRSGLEGILELLEASSELLNRLRGILLAIKALLEAFWALLDACLRARLSKKGCGQLQVGINSLSRGLGEGVGGVANHSPGMMDWRFRVLERRIYTP